MKYRCQPELIMPVHDWSRIDAGIFHDFHHAWIEEIKRALNAGLLPVDYYALAEQQAAGCPYGRPTMPSQTRLSQRITRPVCSLLRPRCASKRNTPMSSTGGRRA